MRVENPVEAAAAFEALRRDRYLRVLGPEQPQDDRSMLERYYDTLPHVKAEREAEEEEQRKAALPLNGAGVLRAALAGGSGTINGDAPPATVQSAAEVIRRELGGVAGRMDATG